MFDVLRLQEKQKKEQLKTLGISYDFPGYVRCPCMRWICVLPLASSSSLSLCGSVRAARGIACPAQAPKVRVETLFFFVYKPCFRLLDLST
jgi:hypothetical protein